MEFPNTTKNTLEQSLATWMCEISALVYKFTLHVNTEQKKKKRTVKLRISIMCKQRASSGAALNISTAECPVSGDGVTLAGILIKSAACIPGEVDTAGLEK